MRLQPILNLIASTLLALFATVVVVRATTETFTAVSQDISDHLAPLYRNCSEDDPECTIKEGSFVVSLHGFYRISSHLTVLENELQRDPTVN
ncbi:hypothetical protein KCU85_g8423, partial [Aureobasidium melanogenum]